VRNLYDSLLSLAEHVASTTPVMPMAYFDQSFAKKPLSFRLDAVVDLAAAWYINFYVSWHRSRPQDIVRYEDVVIGGAKGIFRLVEKLQVPATLTGVEAAIDEARLHHKTRFRVGKVGRGVPQMTAANRERIARLTSSGRAIEHSRELLMQGPQKQLARRPTIEELIWSRTASHLAKYEFLLAHVFASIGFACLSLVAGAQGPLSGGLLFIGLTLVCLGDTWSCWRKYRALQH
jgi:hypothetical protein